MTDPDRDLRELDPVLELARRAAAAPADAELARAGRARIVAEAPGAALVRRSALPRAVLLAAAVLCLAVAAGVVFERSRGLGYEVIGAESAGAVNYVGARPDAPAEVRFSDGSSVVAAPGTRVRVEGTRRHGARLLVEKGALTASIEHRAESNWRFGAGPYEVHVTGTKFRLAWDPERGEIDLRLDEGSVEVESPAGPKRVEVRAGQHFHASARDGSVRVETTLPPGRVATEHAHESPALPAAPKRAESAPAEEPKAPPSVPAEPRQHDESWPELARRGQYQAIVAQARSRGLEGCFRSSPAVDLRALADAARYAGDSATAERSLQALRQRFPGSASGRAAAFLLGRTHESGGDLTSADRWYRTYLSESPRAELAPDALAGRMRVARATSRRADARALAEQYLQRYPSGVDAALARKLAGPD